MATHNALGDPDGPTPPYEDTAELKIPPSLRVRMKQGLGWTYEVVLVPVWNRGLKPLTSPIIVRVPSAVSFMRQQRWNIALFAALLLAIVLAYVGYKYETARMRSAFVPADQGEHSTATPVDRDSDGVADETDQCPDVVSGITPDAKRPGCPAPEQPAAPVPVYPDPSIPAPAALPDEPQATPPADVDGDHDGEAAVPSRRRHVPHRRFKAAVETPRAFCLRMQRDQRWSPCCQDGLPVACSPASSAPHRR